MLSYKLLLSALALFGTTAAAAGDDAHSAVVTEGQHTAPDVRAPAGISIVATLSNNVCSCNVRAASVTMSNFQLDTCYRLAYVVNLVGEQGYPAPDWVLNSVGFINSSTFKTVYTESYSCNGAPTTITNANAFKIVRA
ncbi:hypothetical protein DFH06DRAFT_1443573 [Mycena polygramma]|nr:hypothetical protein DFH06DRAFT_1443573 [Mycena polygramma]